MFRGDSLSRLSFFVLLFKPLFFPLGNFSVKNSLSDPGEIGSARVCGQALVFFSLVSKKLMGVCCPDLGEVGFL